MDITKLTITKIQKLLKQKKISALDVTKAYLARTKKLDPEIKAFITITDELALKQAKKIDDKIQKDQKIGKLAGIPMSIKDIYLTKGIQTTAGSKVLKGYIPQYSSTVYQKLINQDAILIGKTNTDTFAFGASTENSGYFTTKNPWNFDYIPGGSSGGSAACVSSSMSVFSMGSDTGGSIRHPASLCGITGLKPTYGRNSRYGITAMASSFDCPGPLANTVEDIAVITEVTAGKDPLDATTSSTSVPKYSKLLNKHKLKGLKIGLPKEYFSGSIDKQVKQKVLETTKFFEKQGAKIIDISLPSTNQGIAVYYVLVPCEISANMARYDGIRFGQSKKDIKDLLSYYLETRGAFMEDEMKRRIMIGTYALSAGYFDAYYLKASKVRTLIKNEFIETFKKVDTILAPVSPTTAWKIGEKIDDPLQMYLADVFTVCINVAGLPSLALPCGFSSNNLPIGFQLIGNYFQEDKILSIGHQYQQLTDYHFQKPKL
ncbi:Asp-tRNA(Asn)/Glu-tRNA(Gln) amidotransferase subunit GatA [Patescibacteria group bacterium]|nr:Asp-tRNA(Asn)/Glu-tRNA(Gln) amidotransferase subunit GatA [Patescibacteria group bacterium]MCG2702520.1 Asp-tRNA(Asn)/Glu-tRNA(Gln) amidotransferase subunit GatA [Candidatus Parcubacteria bacterium]MBU4265061.1 Asp-tRNA(Asn)/Glu-tRNA(Gln) amidotransferase subunit GatA [Patescibacteria group bacterium]MBU4390270.1 Asp-tRNA(Asn)/Glu-tRNA(Gln) amidotransferase subunit GatA [Patescibacteria group bacterium]MBU4397150.1 Asp-tRNA(Asn)/Glu-tRNA(Gln) amidotransferase subunit GatA [Patescibacteria gr